MYSNEDFERLFIRYKNDVHPKGRKHPNILIQYKSLQRMHQLKAYDIDHHHKCKQIMNINLILILREFGIRSLCDKPAFVNDVDIHGRFLGQKVVRNESCNQV